MNPIHVALAVTATTPEQLQRAMEAMSRAAAGLALEDVYTYLECEPYVETEEDSDVES